MAKPAKKTTKPAKKAVKPKAPEAARTLSVAEKFYIEQKKAMGPEALAAELGIPIEPVVLHLESLRAPPPKTFFIQHASGPVIMTEAQSKLDDDASPASNKEYYDSVGCVHFTDGHPR
jgi:hypothetical protein